MKKTISLLLVTLLVLLCLPALADQPVDLTGKLVILHTNNVHGYAVTSPAAPSVGYAQVKQYKTDAKALGADVLLLDAGDVSQGQPLVNMSKGAEAFQFMNAVGYDAMCPGNHEFDWGVDQFQQNAETAAFPVLSANLLRKSDHTLYLKPTHIFTAGAYQVGVIGLTTPETMTKANPALMTNVDLLMGDALYASTQQYVDELRAAGCNLIVVLGHMGVDDQSAGNRSLDVIAGTTGIDLFIDGHSHVTLNERVPQKHAEGDKDVPTTLLVSAGCYGGYIGEVVYDGKKLSAALYAAQPTQVSAAYGDADVSALVGSVNAQVDAALGQQFAKTTVDLNGERAPGVRTQETNLGDFCADAMLWQANESYSQPVVAAFTNGGSIRASIPAGPVTMKDMKTVFPFSNTISILTVTGAELLELLEASSFSAPQPAGGFLQVAGITYTIHSGVPYTQGDQYPSSTFYAPAKPGSRVTVATVGGQPFDPAAQYVVATNNYLAAGGDQAYVLKYPNQQTGYDTYVALEDALVDYTQTKLGGVIGDTYAQPAGRITVEP